MNVNGDKQKFVVVPFQMMYTIVYQMMLHPINNVRRWMVPLSIITLHNLTGMKHNHQSELQHQCVIRASALIFSCLCSPLILYFIISTWLAIHGYICLILLQLHLLEEATDEGAHVWQLSIGRIHIQVLCHVLSLVSAIKLLHPHRCT